MHSKHQLILFSVITVLLLICISGVGYVLYRINRLSSPPMPGGYQTPVTDSAAATPPGSGIIRVTGTVKSISAGSISIDSGGTVAAVSTDGNTSFVLRGPVKDQETQQKDLDAYNQQLSILLKDPETNKNKIAALQLPFYFTTPSIAQSDIKAGDSVSVVLRKGSNVAMTVIKAPAPLSQP